MRRIGFIFLILMAVSYSLAGADEIESQAKELERELIAPCCWTNTLSEHQSPVAAQMKTRIRFWLREGKSPSEVRDFFAQEFGDRVLAAPRKSGLTLVAWVLPPAVLLMSFLFVFVFLKGRIRSTNTSDEVEPAEEELQAVEQELKLTKSTAPIIGLVGRNCAGKGVAATFLRKQGFAYVSLSDVLREELANQGLEVTRDHLIKKGRELRETHGDGILAKRVIRRIEPGVPTLVDSIRNPGEVAELRKLTNFKLVALRADDRLRFERMRDRGREGDPQTYEEFLDLESLESDSSTKAAQQVLQTEQLADATVENNGSADELGERLGSLVDNFRA